MQQDIKSVMATSYSMQTLVGFRESNFSPWGRSAHRSLLPDASEKYSFCVGSIATVNQIISEKALHYPAELPSIGSKPLTASVTSCEDPVDHSMANGRRRVRKAPNTRKSSHLSPKPSPKSSPAKKEPQLPMISSDDLPPPNEESKLVELASFPGFDPHHPTPLPHGLDPLEQMQRISRAQPMLSVKREGFRETWKNLFYKPASQAIFLDYFWWFFLHTYQNFKLLSVQDQLFNRISANYVSLLCEEVDLRWRDPFFKVYPDAIAQCVYTAFVHAYPASWTSFDDLFKTELLRIIYLWQVGTRPLPTAWKRWNFDILEPTNYLKHLSKEKSEESAPGSAKPPRKKASFELDALLKEWDDKECEEALDRSQEILDLAIDESVGSEEEQESVHISLSNFEEELETAKIHMSPSKEKLVKTQAQATRELLTRNTRTAESAPGYSSENKMSTRRPSTPVCKSKQSVSSTKQEPVEAQPRSVASCSLKVSNSPTKKPLSMKSVASSHVPKPASHKSGAQTQRPHSTQATKATLVPAQRSGMVQSSASARPVMSTFAAPPRTQSNRAVNFPKPNVSAVQKTHPSQPNPGHQAVQMPAPLCTKTQQVPQTKGQSLQPMLAQPKQHPGTPGKAQSKKQSPHKPVQSKTVPQASAKPAQAAASKTDGERKSVWKEKAMEIIKRNKESEQAPVSIKPATFEHAQFDVYGQSPLVQHFLNARSLSRENETKVLTGRTELVEEPEVEFISYNDIISDAIEAGLRNHGDFDELYTEQKKSMAVSHAARVKGAQQHERDVKQLLGKKNEVRHLSNEIAACVLNKGVPVGKDKVAAAIEKALHRVNKLPQ